MGKTILSCLVENKKGGEEWVFSGVYCRGNNSGKEIL